MSLPSGPNAQRGRVAGASAARLIELPGRAVNARRALVPALPGPLVTSAP